MEVKNKNGFQSKKSEIKIGNINKFILLKLLLFLLLIKMRRKVKQRENDNKAREIN